MNEGSERYNNELERGSVNSPNCRPTDMLPSISPFIYQVCMHASIYLSSIIPSIFSVSE